MSVQRVTRWSDEDACWVCRIDSGPLAPVLASGHGDTVAEAERQAGEAFRELVRVLAWDLADASRTSLHA